MTKEKPSLGLALGGGGARGFAHIPFLEVLDEEGIKPVVMSGTSIGSVMGALYAGGMTGRDIRALVESLDIIELVRMLDFSLLPQSGVIHGHGVEKFLEKHLPVKTFEELAIPLRVVAADYWTQQEVVFSSGDLLPAIRASISIPAAFTPYVLEGRVLVDGGVVNPVPFNLLRPYCDVLAALDISGIRHEKIRGRHTVHGHDFDLSRFFGLTQREAGYWDGDGEVHLPGTIEAFQAAFQTMETTLIAEMRKNCPVEIYMKPELINVGIMDFHRHDAIMRSVEPLLEGFRRELRARILR